MVAMAPTTIMNGNIHEGVDDNEMDTTLLCLIVDYSFCLTDDLL